MYADVFDELWDAHIKRRTLDHLDLSRREMVSSLYANGNIGGKDLQNEIESLNYNHELARQQVLTGVTDADVNTTDDGFMADAESSFFKAATKTKAHG